MILFLPELRNYKSPHQREEVSVAALSILLNMVTIPIFGVKEFIHFLGGRSVRYIAFEFVFSFSDFVELEGIARDFGGNIN